MLPLDATLLAGALGVVVLPLLLGIGFGWVLESAGFGDSRVLAGQFYFRDLSVIRVMFTAIVVAMLLVHLSAALGWLDLDLVWVNPTFFLSGIVGGLIMGVGFIVGGYCPGTSLVAAATFKLDGLFFVLGGLAGMALFGENADALAAFSDVGHYGRFTLQDWLGVDAGWVALGVVLLALVFFWATNRFREMATGMDERPDRWAKAGPWALIGAAALLILIGQPDLDSRVARLDPSVAKKLADREVQVSPHELAALLEDDFLPVTLVDLRSESDWNLFHLRDARRLDPSSLGGPLPAWWPTEGATILMSNDETLASRVWLELQARRQPNVFLLEGGVNGWLAAYCGHGDGDAALAMHQALPTGGPDGTLRWRFASALGDRLPASRPDPHHAPPMDFVKKVKLSKAAKKSGGCG